MSRKPIKIFLVIAILFAISVSSNYVCYYTVAAADFLSPGLKFETFDQEFLFSAYESELKVFETSNFFNGFQLATYPFGQSFHLFSEILSLDQKTLVLRC
jgi:hypothetical protein